MANAVKREDTESVTAPAVFQPASKEDYLKAATTTVADAGDLARGWTVASSAPCPEAPQVPGQLFAPSELPDPEVAKAVGFQPQAIPEHLILGADDDVDPQGPEPSTVLKAKYREALRERIVAAAEESDKNAAKAREENTSNKPAAAASSPVGAHK